MGAVATEDPKLFGEWSFEGVNVRDIGLQRYLNLEPIYLPHSGGRHEARRFRKSDMNIAERLINTLMRPGSSGGDKVRVVSVVRNAFKIINLRTGRNPLEVLVRAVENAAPNEDTTRIGYGGVVYRLAVDISPQRRIDLALRFLVRGIKESTFGNRRTLEEAIASQLIGAANNDGSTFAIRRKLEVERIALSSR
ncbi:MAG: 30S ribosomal protein S7 [Candidatus Bathyarchaeota archaeon]|jgi:small subunit ribosomal protein S7|nr:30S ribosomal protein S7 [Candidatus Bathyarchaeota archaeon]